MNASSNASNDNPSTPVNRALSAAALATPGRPQVVAFNPSIPRRPMTSHETQIVRLVSDGMTNAEIGAHLGTSPETVKSELKRIFRKLDVKNRTQAAVAVLRQGQV